MSLGYSSILDMAATPVGVGVITAVLPPSRLPRRARRSLHAVLGLGAGAAVWGALSKPSAAPTVPAGRAVTHPPADDAAPLPVPARLALSSAFGGLVALSSVGGFVLDAQAERALARRGVRHPRVWIGVAAAAISAATARSRSVSAGPPQGPNWPQHAGSAQALC